MLQLPKVHVTDFEPNEAVLLTLVSLNNDSMLESVPITTTAFMELDKKFEHRLSMQASSLLRERWARWESDKLRLIYAHLVRQTKRTQGSNDLFTFRLKSQFHYRNISKVAAMCDQPPAPPLVPVCDQPLVLVRDSEYLENHDVADKSFDHCSLLGNLPVFPGALGDDMGSDSEIVCPETITVESDSEDVPGKPGNEQILQDDPASGDEHLEEDHTAVSEDDGYFPN